MTDATPDLPAFCLGWAFTFYEINQETVQITGNTLSFLVLGVGVCMCLFVVHPIAMLIAIFHIAMLIVEVYGLMSTMNIYLNAVSLSNLIMCTYIGVLFTGYLTRSFMRDLGRDKSRPDPKSATPLEPDTNPAPHCVRQRRATNAFRAVAPPVFHGALGIFLTVVSLAGAKLPYFKNYYFFTYVLIVFLGIGNGLILLPVGMWSHALPPSLFALSCSLRPFVLVCF